MHRGNLTEIIPVEPHTAIATVTASEVTAYLSSTLSHCTYYKVTIEKIKKKQLISNLIDKMWKLTASCTVLTISGSSVAATSAGASPVAIAMTLRAIFRPEKYQDHVNDKIRMQCMYQPSGEVTWLTICSCLPRAGLRGNRRWWECRKRHTLCWGRSGLARSLGINKSWGGRDWECAGGHGYGILWEDRGGKNWRKMLQIIVN